MKTLVTGGRDYEDNGALCFTLDCLRAFTLAASPRDAWGRLTDPLTLAHGACGWDLDKDGPVPPQAESPDYLRFLRKLKGADKVAHLYALEHQLAVRPYPAGWAKGPSGGPRRNEHMFHVEQPNVVIATPGGPGTAHMSRIAREAGTMLWVVEPWRSQVCRNCGRLVAPGPDYQGCEVCS